MVDFRRIKMSLFLILGLQFLAVTEQNTPHIIVRSGDEVTLPCENVKDNQHECKSTTWIISHITGTAAIDLVTLGQIKAKSDRLSLTESCSLVIKKITGEDVGLYFCKQHESDYTSAGYLSVVNMTEHKNGDTKVTLKCSVSTRGRCRFEVKWLFRGKDVDTDNEELKTSQSRCLANLTFTTSHFIYTSKNYKLLTCNVTESNTRKVQLFPFSPQSSVGKNKTESGNISTTTKQDWWWLYIMVPVGLVALSVIVIVVAVIRWKRAKGNKTQTDGDVVPSLNPAVTHSGPETTQDMDDPEDGVSYASISYIKTTNSEAQVHCGGDAVTYSTVKASQSSAGASADPSNLYATIN
ncbi:uncharacterized protein LOC121882136 [Thunnus maccoyii]|uniref:uncharacterized protein LOC121882136 n=1 Tax=Thunnus maccoyii TaxID=8240 RepID=UPI001C4A926E|nr:uncharacterized protein LOC121882136 [Thunnus maccoyii]